MKKKITITLLSVLMAIICAVAVFSIYEGLANNRGPIAALKSYFSAEAEVKPPQDPTPEIPVEHEHEFGEWVMTAEPTCAEEGVETSTCICGEIQTRTVAALGHNFKQNICERCGVSGTTDINGNWFRSDTDPTHVFLFEDGTLTESRAIIAEGTVYEILTIYNQTKSYSTVEEQEVVNVYLNNSDNISYYFLKSSSTMFKVNSGVEIELIPLTNYRIHEHEFDEGEITKEATLTSSGILSMRCLKDCGFLNKETIAPKLLNKAYIAFEEEEGIAAYVFIADGATKVCFYFGYVEIVNNELKLLNNVNDSDYVRSCSSDGNKIYIGDNFETYLLFDENACCLRDSEDDSIFLPELTGFDTISFG